MRITSPAFENGDTIPKEFTCDGKNISPPLQIFDVPDSAKVLVLIMDDVDSPSGVFTHWIVYDIYSGIKSIEAGASIEGSYGKNSFGEENYQGPCPSSGQHKYFFRVYAIDVFLKLLPGLTREEVEKKMRGHVVESCEMMGVYRKA